VRLPLLLVLTATLTAFPLPAQVPAPSKPDVGEGLKREREHLANFEWRLRTEMKVDGVLRVSVGLEDVRDLVEDFEHALA